MKESEVFYVGIQTPAEIRKDILMSAKSTITSLKRYEQFRILRDEKLSQIVQLKKVLDELASLNRKFRSALPKTGVRPEFPAKKEEPERVIRKEVARKPEAPKRTKMDVLEEELAKIESRLSSLE